jgi:hypothetical protein
MIRMKRIEEEMESLRKRKRRAVCGKKREEFLNK